MSIPAMVLPDFFMSFPILLTPVANTPVFRSVTGEA
jgi:hypothetical protein